jgi:hypothetical protein
MVFLSSYSLVSILGLQRLRVLDLRVGCILPSGLFFDKYRIQNYKIPGFYIYIYKQKECFQRQLLSSGVIPVLLIYSNYDVFFLYNRWQKDAWLPQYRYAFIKKPFFSLCALVVSITVLLIDK